MEFTQQEEKRIRLGFTASVLIKGAISIGEIATSIAILFVPASYLSSPLFKFAQDTPVSAAVYISIYLFIRGFIKAFLIWAMLKRQLWAYPAMLGVMALLLLYQFYQIATAHSVLIVLLTLFDLVVMYFIWREYQVLKFEANPSRS
jgi:uncharacterized membrane protein